MTAAAALIGTAQNSTEKRYHLLLDTLPHGVQETNCQGVITYSNRAHHRLLGCEFGELIGKHIWDFLSDPAECEFLKNYLQQLVNERPTPAPYLSKNCKKDGTEVILQVDWNYERDPAGEVTGFVSVVTDITARHQAEEALLRRTEGLATLLKVSKKIAETLDAPTILQAAVDGVTSLSGLDTAAVYLLAGNFLQLQATTPPLPTDFPESLRTALLSDHPHIEQTISTAEPLLINDFTAAELSPAEAAVVAQRGLRTAFFVPMVADESVVGVFIVGSVGDISEVTSATIDLSLTLANLTALTVKNAQLYLEKTQRAAELQQALAEREVLQAQLLQSQKLEAIGRLAGGVAHDFNNMLGLILGHAQLSLRKLPTDHPAHTHLQQIQNAAQRSADLTRQLLAFARKQTIAPELLDLNVVVSNMLKMLRRLMGENIDLVWQPAKELGLVKLDPSQVDQILINLCVNARDAIIANGKVTIETSNTSFDENYCADHPDFLPGEYVMLVVGDDGIGMDSTILSNIFEPFYTTKGTGQGTGLGLSTVYGIVKQNKGFLNVYSEPGQGSCFKIYLRRQVVTGLDVAKLAVEQLKLEGSETILVVEDEQKLLELAKEMLESFGYQVLTAQSPQVALNVVEKSAVKIDLLVTDVVMPQMNGLELAKRLQQIIPQLKVLFVSGYTANVIAHHGVLYEGVSFLSKPFSKEQLASKVRETLLT